MKGDHLGVLTTTAGLQSGLPSHRCLTAPARLRILWVDYATPTDEWDRFRFHAATAPHVRMIVPRKIPNSTRRSNYQFDDWRLRPSRRLFARAKPAAAVKFTSPRGHPVAT